MKKNKNILILGAYGQNNIGDEAMLSVLVSVIKKEFINSYITCNSNNPIDTQKLFDIDSFHTSLSRDFFKKIKSFLTADTIIYGGGSLLVELRMNPLGKRYALYRGFIINIFARLTFKKVIYLGVGAEDVSEGLSRFLMKKCVNLSHTCYVRDKISMDILLDYGCDKGKVVFASELVFDSPLKQNLKQTIKKIIIFPVYRILGFDKFYNDYTESLRLYSEEMKKRGIEVVFFPMQTDVNDPFNDVKVIEDITGKKEMRRNDYGMTVNEFNDFIKDFDIVLSSRYHGLIFGLINSIPVISLTEYQKSSGVLNLLSLSEYSLKSDMIKLELLLSITDNIEKNYSLISGHIYAEVLKQKNKIKEVLSEVINIIK